MVAVGWWCFVCGVHLACAAKGWKLLPGGELSAFEGPFLKAGEQVGGFWVIEAPSMDDAMEWGRKAAIACRAPVEVRQFH